MIDDEGGVTVKLVLKQKVFSMKEAFTVMDEGGSPHL